MASYFSFKENVYIVHGAFRACIYDLNAQCLYSISGCLEAIILKLLFEDHYYDLISDADRGYINYLVDNEVLLPTQTKMPMKDIKSIAEPYLVQFSWIEVTRKCNLKCHFCYEESSPECVEKMSLADFKLVVENLKTSAIKNIQFIGGEPMVLGKDLKAMIEYCCNDFSFIEVYTNGVFINDDWARFFKKYNIHVAISIHSYDSEMHDRVTCIKGSHQKVENAVALLKVHQVPFRIGSVETSACKVGHKKLNQPYDIFPKPVRLTGRGGFHQYNLDIFKKKAITKNTHRYPITADKITMHVSGHQCFLNDLYISAKLDVFPCVMERRFKYGNLRQGRLIDMLDHPTRYLSKDDIEGCQDCEYRYNCFDCRPDSNGRGQYQKPWYCSYNPYTGEWADLEDMYHTLKCASDPGSFCRESVKV